ncbi:MAG: bifunctional 4-hydroxy-2-oxoglutarate aldolase/2-dehydro-3-deoxy-phosphogluconate aldolase [Actinomycetota bacterium]|jgi:2-dehydro-3-deoxyphosphogluconate aldolase/(4S)-4-hydroxy-2-oxoglutarate aldolase
MIELIKSLRIVPVVAISDASKAAGLASALVAGGLPIAEITLRTPASLEALKIAASNKDLLVGVGSLRTGEDLKKAVDVGARFAVSAGFSSSVAVEADKQGIPYLPGVSTPTEMLQAINAGISTLKFFPAETLGGVAALKAMSAPFPGINFMPTGGISPSNAKEYLSLPSVVAVGGSWMVAQKLIDAGDFETIISLTKEAVEVCAP